MAMDFARLWSLAGTLPRLEFYDSVGEVTPNVVYDILYSYCVQ